MHTKESGFNSSAKDAQLIVIKNMKIKISQQKETSKGFKKNSTTINSTVLNFITSHGLKPSFSNTSKLLDHHKRQVQYTKEKSKNHKIASYSENESSINTNPKDLSIKERGTK